MVNFCCRWFAWEFHYSRFWFFHKDWRRFTYTPWLPYQWYFQLLYIIYRWIIAIYFFVWLFIAGFYNANGGVRFFIFLTNWAILSFNVYLVWAAFSTTLHFLRVHTWHKHKYSDAVHRGSSDYELEKPKGCCGLKSNNISWYHMIHWLLFTVGGEVATAISILYWPLLYRPGVTRLSGVNINTHLINGVVGLVDLWITGIPVYVYHFLYAQLFFGTYTVFTGFYHAANGTNVNGDPYIYGLLDYGETPGTATGIIFATILIYVPIIHVFFYLQYLARYWLVYCVYGRNEQHTPLKSGGTPPPPVGGGDIEMTESDKLKS